MTKIKYSIVIAVFNRPDEMAELLSSIASQNFKKVYIIKSNKEFQKKNYKRLI